MLRDNGGTLSQPDGKKDLQDVRHKLHIGRYPLFQQEIEDLTSIRWS